MCTDAADHMFVLLCCTGSCQQCKAMCAPTYNSARTKLQSNSPLCQQQLPTQLPRSLQLPWTPPSAHWRLLSCLMQQTPGSPSPPSQQSKQQQSFPSRQLPSQAYGRLLRLLQQKTRRMQLQCLGLGATMLFWGCHSFSASLMQVMQVVAKVVVCMAPCPLWACAETDGHMLGLLLRC